MANKTVYPYGTGGSLPSSVGIINDLTTGGADKALSAEQGKVLGQAIVEATFPEEAKLQLITTLEKVAWVTPDVQDTLDDLSIAMGAVSVESITAVFTQGQMVVTNRSSLNSLRQNLVVTGIADGITINISNYTLSGELQVGTSTITVTYNSLTTTFSVSVVEYGTVDFVPEGYTLVEYISTNGAPYIDLGFKSNEATDAYYVDLMFTTVTTQMRILSANESSTAATLYLNSTYQIGFRYRGTASYMGSGSPVIGANERHTIFIDFKNLVGEVDGDTMTPTFATSGTKAVAGSNCLLAGPATTNARFIGRIYRVRIYRNDSLIRDLVPCRDDNNLGYMYDMYNDVIYSRSGSGAFGIGSDVNE